MQPARQPFRLADGDRLPGQHDKGRLKVVLGVMGVLQHPLADAQNQRTVSPHQRLERRFLLAGSKALQ
jgi:hypothetical protein